jgi:hypothetical protein
MKSKPSWKHWRTTVTGILLGMWTLLSSANDITSVSWRELAERLPKAFFIVCLGVLARDTEEPECSTGDDPHG